ncbi:MAG: peptigoglycan-binding protein LysM, partial [Mesorhizobium sp.]
MAITSLRALLFTAGGVVAVGGVAYVSGAFDRPSVQPPQAEVAAPAPAATAAGTQGRVTASADAKAEAPATAGDTAAAPKAPAAPAPSATVIAPTFDVVRVQGDGSVVVAGKAAADAKVEIVHGSVVLGETKAGPDGTFAIVLDDPLKPGDYQIVLRSTAPNNVVATSEQTAVVSVPEKAGGQVLAMVEEPGKPAELLTVPEPEKKAEAPTPAVGGAPTAGAPAAPASGEAQAPQP